MNLRDEVEADLACVGFDRSFDVYNARVYKNRTHVCVEVDNARPNCVVLLNSRKRFCGFERVYVDLNNQEWHGPPPELCRYSTSTTWVNNIVTVTVELDNGVVHHDDQ